MGLYTGTVKNLHRAPYRDQVLSHLIRAGEGENLSPVEDEKVERVKRFLDAHQCAREIAEARRIKRAGAA